MSVLGNATDYMKNFTSSGWYMIVIDTIRPFEIIAFPLLYLFVFGITFIRTRDVSACVFVTLLFTALYVNFVSEWVMKMIYVASAVILGGLLWLVFGRR
ncbi:MAG: hypothetical protein RMH75_07525 [Archaeoglobaceae archaeon]|nr:hypothetical protein [Archaeoglobaceae archaeon]MDW7990489.1 hypothetical protein [Archaeoglobaceae archaeon]